MALLGATLTRRAHRGSQPIGGRPANPQGVKAAARRWPLP